VSIPDITSKFNGVLNFTTSTFVSLLSITFLIGVDSSPSLAINSNSPGIVTFVNLLHSLNIFGPILFTPDGILISFNPVFENAFAFISSTVFEIFNFFKLALPENAHIGKVVIPFPIFISFTYAFPTLTGISPLPVMFITPFFNDIFPPLIGMFMYFA